MMHSNFTKLSKIAIAIALYFSVVVSALAAYPVNVNTASADQLAEALNGVGPQKAQAIVEYRKANGPFTKAEDLLKVKGIGEKMLEKNRDFVLLK